MDAIYDLGVPAWITK